jgi:hypothetical protein
VQALIAHYDKAMAEARQLSDAAKTDEEKAKLGPLFPQTEPYATLLMQIAEENPRSPAAFDALFWIWRVDKWRKAKAILIRDHLLNPKIGPFCLMLRDEVGDAGALKALRCVFADNPDKEAQAYAAVALAIMLTSNASGARKLREADPQTFAKWENLLGTTVATFLKSQDPDALEKEIEEVLERVMRDKACAETTVFFAPGRTRPGDLCYRPEGRTKVRELATQELYALRHLRPGKPVPETAGVDIDGKPMKLGDFRGKVILLDFWGLG